MPDGPALTDVARRAFNQPLAMLPSLAAQSVAIEAALAGLPGVSFDGGPLVRAVPVEGGGSGGSSLRVQLEETAAAEALYRFDRETGIAVIPVMGTLWHRWGYGYKTQRLALRQALGEPQVKGLLIEIDSGGGEAAGCFDLVDEIRAARAVKPVWAVANEFAASAAYAIGSAAEVFVAPRSAQVGSIGVISLLMNCAGWMESQGLEIAVIKAGRLKDQGNPFRPFEDEAMAAFQRRTDALYDRFVETVARNRGLSGEVVRGTEADVFTGEEARDLGLISATASYSETWSTFAELLNDGAAVPTA